MTKQAAPKQKRLVFIVSDGTAITAENLARSLLTQFEGLEYTQERLPFVDTPAKALQAAEKINAYASKTDKRPLVFSTLANIDVSDTFMSNCHAYVLELFRNYLGPLEQELGLLSCHTTGNTHRLRNVAVYDRRIAAIDYTLTHDDGQTNNRLDEADVILVGVSRSGKTPTSLYLAMQYGVKAANYPLTPDDFDRGCLPDALTGLHSKCFGLTISPERLSEIRQERMPNSTYASLANCREELEGARELMDDEGIEWMSSTNKSIEEIAATIVHTRNLASDI